MHFASEGMPTDRIPLGNLIGDGVVIDVSKQAPARPFTLVSQRTHRPVEFSNVALLVDIGQEACDERVFRQRTDVGVAQVESLLDATIIFDDVATKVRGIIGIDRCAKSMLQEQLEIVLLKRIKHAKFDV